MQIRQIRRLEALEDAVTKLTGQGEKLTIHIVNEVPPTDGSIHQFDADGKDCCEEIEVPLQLEDLAY